MSLKRKHYGHVSSTFDWTPILFLCHTVLTSNFSLASPWILIIEVRFVCIDQES